MLVSSTWQGKLHFNLCWRKPWEEIQRLPLPGKTDCCTYTMHSNSCTTTHIFFIPQWKQDLGVTNQSRSLVQCSFSFFSWSVIQGHQLEEQIYGRMHWNWACPHRHPMLASPKCLFSSWASHGSTRWLSSPSVAGISHWPFVVSKSTLFNSKAEVGACTCRQKQRTSSLTWAISAFRMILWKVFSKSPCRSVHPSITDSSSKRKKRWTVVEFQGRKEQFNTHCCLSLSFRWHQLKQAAVAAPLLTHLSFSPAKAFP